MKILRNLEKVYVVLALFFLTGAGVAGNVGAGGAAGRALPEVWENVARLIFCATLLPLLVIHWRKLLAAALQSGWIVALCGLAVASTVWAFDPRFTARHAIFLMAVTAFGIYIASCFDWNEQMDLFGWMSVLVVFGSAAAAIFVPSFGLSQDLHAGAVKGLYPQKNTMSALVAFAILIFALARPKGVPTWLRTTTLVGACVLLILSQSATAMVALAFCIVMYPIVHLLRVPNRKTLPLWVPLIPVFAGCAFFAIVNFDFIAETAGRNSTLSDRIPMWNEVLNAIGRHPWLGYGYDVFWVEWSRDLAQVIYVLNGWRPPHAHNGYLDLLLSVGIVGLLIFLGGLITSLWRAGKLFRADGSREAKWPLFVLLFFVVLNLGESFILRIMSFFWVPYVAIYVSLALQKFEARAPVPAETMRNAFREDDDAADFNTAVPDYQT
jgi:exopolysaccharide production protein ExoQ